LLSQLINSWDPLTQVDAKLRKQTNKQKERKKENKQTERKKESSPVLIPS
jgi:hypothetical protein